MHLGCFLFYPFPCKDLLLLSAVNNSDFNSLQILIPITVQVKTMIPKQIGFRLTADEAKQLYFDARDHGVSAHIRARDMVIEGLTLSRIEGYLEQMVQELEVVKHDQSLIQQAVEANRWGLVETLAVLVANVEGVTRDQAREWIREQFTKP